ncbi:hypothetical protein B0H15DRAFT_1021508 [Mycena belliarum]|uniref:Uncharacterized protein n=1 Tax=Mycena belliarum TaxID=1033014 RepID=A0AAD6U820_9AGAR|nr:hypothetical protein B0H15DRAFT_1021508 [Mycena belliae]
MAALSETSLSLIASAPLTSATATKALLEVLLVLTAVYYIFHLTSPSRLLRALLAAIAELESSYIDALERGAFSPSDLSIAATLAALQLKVSTIREAALRNSLSYRAALREFLKGQTLTMLQCIHEVRVLGTHIELLYQQILKEAHLRASSPDVEAFESVTRAVAVRQRCKY